MNFYGPIVLQAVVRRPPFTFDPLLLEIKSWWILSDKFLTLREGLDLQIEEFSIAPVEFHQFLVGP